MAFLCKALTQSLSHVGSVAVEVYTTGNRDGLKRTSLLLLTCSLLSIFLSSLLLLYLRFILGYNATVAGWTSGCIGILLTVALVLSQGVRCVGILFMISCFMKQSRKLLLTAVFTFVILRNVRNTLENLTALIRSMICNLKAKRAAISLTPLSNYIKMLKWVGVILGQFKDLGWLKLDTDLRVSPKIDSERFREKLADAERNLNETAGRALSIAHAVSSVTHKMFPAVSFLLLFAFISLHVKKYRRDVRYKNVFISGRFVSFDERQGAEGRPRVLPLTPEEAKTYFFIPSVHPTRSEGRAALKFVLPAMSHFVCWVLFLALDALMYYFVNIVTTYLSELEPFNVPLVMKLKATKTFIGISTAEENQRKDFSYSITLFEKKCLPKPKLLLYDSVAPLAVIVAALLAMASMAGKLTQLRLLVCERFFSADAEERVRHLHAKILRKRSKARARESEGADGGTLRSFVFEPHFWCPLLFGKQDRDEQDSMSAA